MKPKLILCLALVLSGWWSGYSSEIMAGETNAANESNYSYSAGRKSEWVGTKITLYRSTGEAAQLDAKTAICHFKMISKNLPDALLVAFVDSKSSKAFIGLADGSQTNGIKDFYVETDSGITSVLNRMSAGTLIWEKNAITNTTMATTLDNLTGQFDRRTDLQEAVARAGWDRFKTQINLSPYFRQWFFYPLVGVSFYRDMPFQPTELHTGQMRLDFTSPALGIPGSAWIDLKTWKLVKAVEDGKRVYPAR
jgi:hypothetical protein